MGAGKGVGVGDTAVQPSSNKQVSKRTIRLTITFYQRQRLILSRDIQT